MRHSLKYSNPIALLSFLVIAFALAFASQKHMSRTLIEGNENWCPNRQGLGGGASGCISDKPFPGACGTCGNCFFNCDQYPGCNSPPRCDSPPPPPPATIASIPNRRNRPSTYGDADNVVITIQYSGRIQDTNMPFLSIYLGDSTWVWSGAVAYRSGQFSMMNNPMDDRFKNFENQSKPDDVKTIIINFNIKQKRLRATLNGNIIYDAPPSSWGNVNRKQLEIIEFSKDYHSGGKHANQMMFRNVTVSPESVYSMSKVREMPPEIQPGNIRQSNMNVARNIEQEKAAIAKAEAEAANAAKAKAEAEAAKARADAAKARADAAKARAEAEAARADEVEAAAAPSRRANRRSGNDVQRGKCTVSSDIDKKFSTTSDDITTQHNLYVVKDANDNYITGLTGSEIGKDREILERHCDNTDDIMKPQNYVRFAESTASRLSAAAGIKDRSRESISYIDEMGNNDIRDLRGIRPTRLMSTTDMWGDPAFKSADGHPLGMGLKSWTTNYKIQPNGMIDYNKKLSDSEIMALKNYEPIPANAFIDIA